MSYHDNNSTRNIALSPLIGALSAALSQANQPRSSVWQRADGDFEFSFSQPAKRARGEAEGRGATAPLGNNPKSVDQGDDQERKKIYKKQVRRQLYAELKTAAFIIREHVRRDHAVAKCRWCKVAGQVGLHLVRYPAQGKQSASVGAVYNGVKICGNVWGCPVCAVRISNTRRDEMNRLLAWARAEGLVPVMLTLTARHGRKDRLEDLLERMKLAKRRMRQRREWRALPFRGSVTATEITHGVKNGWHPHFHELVLLEAEDEAHALEMVEELGAVWRSSLRAYGLDGRTAAFQAQGAAAAGDYVTKWGAAEEMVLSQAKEGRESKDGKGRSPRELLRLAGDGDVSARRLWAEYFDATSGKRRRQLVWSPGLKEECGVKEFTDEEAAEAEIEEEEPTPLAIWDGEGWRQVRTRRVMMLEAAEQYQTAAAVLVASVGPPDPGQESEDETELIEDLETAMDATQIQELKLLVQEGGKE